MTVGMNGALRRCLAASAFGGLIAFAPVSAATAQWLPPPWRTIFPGDIERSLEARGYVLTGPLMRQPGVYLADVNAGPGGYQRLVIDARSGVILERFPAPGRVWGSAFAAQGEEFRGPPPPWGAGPPPSPGFPGAPGPAPAAKSAYGGPANVHIPAAISPYDSGAAPAGAKPKPKSASTGRKSPASKSEAPIVNPPLPPPAPREPAKPGGSGSPSFPPGSTDVENDPPAAAPAAPGPSADASDQAKVSVVPAAPFE
jgi:hypothetical protein